MSRKYPGKMHKARVICGGTLPQIRAATRKKENAFRTNFRESTASSKKCHNEYSCYSGGYSNSYTTTSVASQSDAYVSSHRQVNPPQNVVPGLFESYAWMSTLTNTEIEDTEELIALNIHVAHRQLTYRLGIPGLLALFAVSFLFYCDPRAAILLGSLIVVGVLYFIGDVLSDFRDWKNDLDRYASQLSIAKKALSTPSDNLPPPLPLDEIHSAGEPQVETGNQSMLSPKVALVLSGNPVSKIFHKQGCIHYQCNYPPNPPIVFKSKDEAVGKGYRPCKKCSP